MNHYAIYEAHTGKILQVCAFQEGDVNSVLTPGNLALPLEHGIDSSKFCVLDGVLTAMEPQPGPHHAFDWTAKQWTDPRTLADLRAAKWAEIKQAREAALAAPLVTPFGVFDAGPAASANIVKSVLLANNLNALGYPVAIDFTLFDNSVVTLSAAAMVQVGLILAGREQAIRNQATVLRAQIESATADELSAVAWPAN